MGGYGSGRRGYRTTVEDCLTLSIYSLQRDGMLRGGWFKVWWSRGGERFADIRVQNDCQDSCLLLLYTKTLGGEAHSIRDSVYLEATPAFFGCERYWFRCPRCGSRRGKLHLPAGALHFYCRDCYNLTYTSSNESGSNDGFIRLLARESGFSPKDVRHGLREMRRG